MLKTTAGRAFAAKPKSTSQVSPRSMLGMFGFLLVVGQESFLRRCDQVGVRHHAVGIIVDEVAAPLAILVVQRLLDAQELFGAQLWERRFDFGDRAHGGKLSVRGWSVNAGKQKEAG